MPITFATTAIAVFAISGLPFTSGFLSKDMILGEALAFGIVEHPQHFLIPLFGFAAAAMTAFYMFRLLTMTFLGEFKHEEQVRDWFHESPWNMTLPLVVLAGLSAWFWYNPDPTALFGTSWVSSFIPTPAPAAFGLMSNLPEHARHSAHVAAMVLSLACAAAGVGVAWALNKRGTLSLENWRVSGSLVYRLLANKFYVDELYDRTAIAWAVQGSRWLGWFDKVVIDGLVDAAGRLQKGFAELSGLMDKHGVDGLVNALANFVRGTGNDLRQLQTGRIQNYLVYAAVGLIVMIVITGM